MNTVKLKECENWYSRFDSHKERYCIRRRAFRRAIDGFHFGEKWLNSEDGLVNLLNHCKNILREQEFLSGPSLNVFANRIDCIDDIRVGKHRSLPWVQFVDTLIGQRHLAFKTPPASARAFLVTFLNFPLNSSEKMIFVYDFPRNNPWRILRPCNGDSLEMLEMVFRGLMDENDT